MEEETLELPQDSPVSNELPIPETPPESDHEKRSSVRERLSSRLVRFVVNLKTPLMNIGTWLGFSVIIALAPIIASFLGATVVNQPYNLEATLKHGELLAISIALMGEALGYLLTNPNANVTLKSGVSLGCTLVLLISAMVLGNLSVEKLSTDATHVTNISLVSFVCTLVLGCFCKWKDA